MATESSFLDCPTCGEQYIYRRDLHKHACPPEWLILYDIGDGNLDADDADNIRGKLFAIDGKTAAEEYARLHHVDFDYSAEIKIRVRANKPGSAILEFTIDVTSEPVYKARRRWI